MSAGAKQFDRQIYYDTGIYCSIAEDTLTDLMQAEARDRIESVAHPVVVAEILHKLVSFDRDETVFKRGRAGTCRLHQHVMQGRGGLRLVLTMQRRLQMELFGRSVPTLMQLAYSSAVAEVVAKWEDPSTWSAETRQIITGAHAVNEVPRYGTTG